MNSASKVGEIFTKAGETFHKLADMTVMLDPNAKELLVGGAKVRFSFWYTYIVDFMCQSVYSFQSFANPKLHPKNLNL